MKNRRQSMPVFVRKTAPSMPFTQPIANGTPASAHPSRHPRQSEQAATSTRDATTNALLSSVQYIAFGADGNFTGASTNVLATP